MTDLQLVLDGRRANKRKTPLYLLGGLGCHLLLVVDVPLGLLLNRGQISARSNLKILNLTVSKSSDQQDGQAPHRLSFVQHL